MGKKVPDAVGRTFELAVQSFTRWNDLTPAKMQTSRGELQNGAKRCRTRFGLLLAEDKGPWRLFPELSNTEDVELFREEVVLEEVELTAAELSIAEYERDLGEASVVPFD